MNKEERIRALEFEIRALRNALKDYGIIRVNETGRDGSPLTFCQDHHTLPERFASIEREFNDASEEVTNLRFRVTELEKKAKVE